MQVSGSVRNAFRLLPLLLAGSVVFTLPLCGQTSESDPTQPQTTASTDNTRVRGQHHDAGSIEASGPELKDKMFLRKATADGMLEVKLGELAQSKSQSDDVKQMGRHMADDHTKINEAMQPIAEAQGVMLPTKLPPKEQATFDRLNGLTGDEFDREYLKAMVAGHHADLHEFRSEAANTQDATLREATQNAAKTIREHTVAVDALARSKGIEVRGRVAPPAPPQ